MFSKLGGGGKPEEEKTVTAGTSVTEVLPSSGKTMKKVTVNPTPSQSKTVTPSTSQQTVSPDSGKLLSKVIVKAMENVTPEVTAQTPIIAEIAENFGVAITTPSGTNKQILHGNNSNLQSIKTNAKKSGAYVWKRTAYTESEVSVTNPSCSVSGTQNMVLSNANFDLDSVDTSFFDGFSGGSISFAMVNGVLNCYFGGSQYATATYEPSTHTLVQTAAMGTISSMSYTGKKTYTFTVETVDFVVSDSESAYPDGGTQDGYWYEKVVEGVDLLTAMGYTKIAVDKFTFTSRTTANSSKKISHSLGVEPKSVLLLSPLTYSKMQQFDILNGYYQNFSESSPTTLSGSLLYANSNSGDFKSADGYVHLVSGETTTKLYFNSSYYFKAGIEYTLITMA